MRRFLRGFPRKQSCRFLPRDPASRAAARAGAGAAARPRRRGQCGSAGEAGGAGGGRREHGRAGGGGGAPGAGRGGAGVARSARRNPHRTSPREAPRTRRGLPPRAPSARRSPRGGREHVGAPPVRSLGGARRAAARAARPAGRPPARRPRPRPRDRRRRRPASRCVPQARRRRRGRAGTGRSRAGPALAAARGPRAPGQRARQRRRRPRASGAAAGMSGAAEAAPVAAASQEESEDESEVLEESPCGRWQKRKEQVNQGNRPGLQSTFLAMDTEEGVEVVWNELQFTDRKAFVAHEEKIKTVFEQLVVVDHPNIVKVHKYWLDVKESRAQVIFITEYVSSGSLKQFLKKTKKNHKAMNARAWKRWCTQILSALSYLHSCDPPIIHGNLTSDTIFIQHNGLIKIGSVWHRVSAKGKGFLPARLTLPQPLRRDSQQAEAETEGEAGTRAGGLPSPGGPCLGRGRVPRGSWGSGMGTCAPWVAVWSQVIPGGSGAPTASSSPRGAPLTPALVLPAAALPPELRSPLCAGREEQRNLHFFPPEYGRAADGTAVDIFSFGMCALEMAVLEIQSNGDACVTEEAIERARHSLDDPIMREFILGCLLPNPDRRPTAHNLLFHRVLFEVHSLKLLAAHCFISNQYLWPENVVEEKTKELDLSIVMAEIQHVGRPPVQWRYSEVSFLELDKFLEDVRNGIYPLMNFASARPHSLPRSASQPPEDSQKAKTPTPEPFDVETRKVVQMQCSMEWNEEKRQRHLTLLLVLEDKLHRQLSYDLLPTDHPRALAADLVHYGFISQDDCEKLAGFLDSAFHKHQAPPS